MASIHPKIPANVIAAAQWLANTREPLRFPVAPILRARFGLSQVEAIVALFEATYATAVADGINHEKAFEFSLKMTFADGCAQIKAETENSHGHER